MNNRQVLVVGSLNADFVMRVRTLPRPGETVRGDALQIVGGGKGANQAIAAARLGASVSMIGAVGSDDYGSMLVGELEMSGVNVDGVLSQPDRQTGIAVIFVDDDGRNQIAISAGANHAIPSEHLEKTIAGRRVDVCLLQLEIPLDQVIDAAQRAKAAGAFVILDPAPAAPLPEELLASVDLITPNETETFTLTGVEVVDAETAEQATTRLRRQRVSAAIIKMGDKGAFVHDDAGTEFIPATPVRAVDTTAAGDAFNGAVAAGISDGLSLSAAARYACVVGALTVTRPGAYPSLPTTDEVLRFMRDRPELSGVAVPHRRRQRISRGG